MVSVARQVVTEQYVSRAVREPNIARRAKLIGKAAVIAAILAGLAAKAESLSVGG